MLNKEDLRQLSDLLDEKFEANNAVLRAEMAEGNARLREELRAEMAEGNAKLREELRAEMNQTADKLREEMNLGIAQLRGDMVKENTLLKEQMASGFAQLNSRLAHVETDVAQLKTDVHNINMTIDYEIRPNIKLLLETFIPEARRFSKAADEIYAMKADIDVLNLTVAKHSKNFAQSAAT